MKDFLYKLTSRKFIACLIGTVVGIAVTFGIDGDTITKVAGLIVSMGSVGTYIVTEGCIDAKAVQQVVDVIEGIEILGEEETIDDIQ